MTRIFTTLSYEAPPLRMNRLAALSLSLVIGFWPVILIVAQSHAADPYNDYIHTSPDFRTVKQDRAWALKAWPSWTYMPWTHQWGIGFTELQIVGDWIL